MTRPFLVENEPPETAESRHTARACAGRTSPPTAGNGMSSDDESGSMESPLVSVVLTTHYRNEWLRRAIESALAQNYPNVEVIVVDDSGEAHAESVVASFEGVEYVPQPENTGTATAREAGFERANGRYIQFLDDDDRLHPEKIARQVPLIDGDESVGVVYSGLYHERDGLAMLPNPDGCGDIVELVLTMQQAPCLPSTMLIDRDLFEDVLPIPAYHAANDVVPTLELARRTDFEYVAEPLVLRGETDGSLAYTEAAVTTRRHIVREYADLYDEFPEHVRRTALAGSYVVEGQVHLRRHRWSARAIRAFALAAYHTPGVRPDFVGSFVASLFGRRVWNASRTVLSRIQRWRESRNRHDTIPADETLKRRLTRTERREE